MAMEKPLNMENFGHVNVSADLHYNASTIGSIHVSNGFRENEDLAEDIVKELDLYWEDIDDRLTISRMVGDSVIKGMVNAVELEAADKIAEKELELARLKETMRLYHVNSYENESLESLMNHCEDKIGDCGLRSSSSDALVELEKIIVSIGKLKTDTWGQLKNLREEIDRIRGSNSMRRINSGSELVGLGGILQEDISRKWTDVDITVDLLNSSLGSVYKQVDNFACLSRTSLCQWELEHRYQEGIKSMVIANCIYGLQEGFENRLLNQMQLNHIENTKFLDKMKEISSFRQELDAITKSLSSAETGHLTLHGSMEFVDDLKHDKRTDHLHHMGLGNHVSLSTSFPEGNGKRDESVKTASENLDFSHLTHLKKEELVQYFKTETTKMKRHHDYEIGKLTEELFTLKAKYYKERGSSLPPKKDKEFDILRRKIPDVITRLDDILVEYGKLPALNNHDDGLDCLHERVDSLLSENRFLRDLLEEKKKEVNHLSSQVSDAVQKMSKHSLAEANSSLMKENLESAVVDMHIEASLTEEVCKCVFKDVIYHVKCAIRESDVEKNVMKEIYEIVLADAASKATLTGSLEFEDLWLEFVTEKELFEIIFREAFNGAKEKLNDLGWDVFKKERALCLAVMGKERLKQDMLLLKASVEEKEKLLQEAGHTLEEEKKHHELVSKELENLRVQRIEQQTLILKCSEESNDLKHNLSAALEKIKLQEAEKFEINQKFDQAMKKLSESSDEKRRLLAVIQENKSSLSLFESREKVNREQMESAITLMQGLWATVDRFKQRVEGDMERTDLRLQSLDSQLGYIGQKANMLKKRLERKTFDLQKAETEVDLLGDEVDALLSLLGKIYIALDHYSPVLQYYPGIVEILKLVRSELSGESTKNRQSIKKV